MVRRTLLYAFCLICASISWLLWSFTLTDPNLWFSSAPSFVAVQELFWSISTSVKVYWYVMNIVGSIGLAAYGVLTLKRYPPKGIRMFLSIYLLFFAPLLLANPALSHDLYNYLFNAKAVVVYQQNPHLRSALDINPQDSWVRFMHNVHTTAPYGEVFTAMTVPVFFLSQGRFVLAFLFTKMLMAIALILAVLTIYWMLSEYSHRERWIRLAVFALNPLVIIETLLNGHNDMVMMSAAVASFGLLLSRKWGRWGILISATLLLFSTQIKYVTVLLFPLWCLLYMHRLQNVTIFSRWHSVLSTVRKNWADLAVFLLFLPLLSDRSQQFHPWYLIWVLTFLPFVRSTPMILLMLAFSATSMFRYIPVLSSAGEYTDQIQIQMRLITWSAVFLIPVSLLKKRFLTRIQ